MIRSVVCSLLLAFAMSVEATEPARGIPNGSSTDEEFLDWLKPTADAAYGVTKKHPVEIGGFLSGDGSRWSAQYFSSLLGPNGEPTRFERKGSCCGFKVTDPELVKQGFDIGLLDVYEVTIEGKPPIEVFVSLYGESEIFAPVGFTTRGKTQAAAP